MKNCLMCMGIVACAFSSGFVWAVDLVEGAALTVPPGESCVVSGTHTIPSFSNKGVLTLTEGADVTVSGTQTAGSIVADGVNGSLNLEPNARLVIWSYDRNQNNQSLVGGYLGGTGTVNVAQGALLSLLENSAQFRLSSNSASDRTRLTYGILNVSGTVELKTLELAAFWPSGVTDTNLYARSGEVNLLPGGVFSADSISANDASISRINFRGGTLKMKASNWSYVSTSYGALVELDFAAGTESAIETAGSLTFNMGALINVSGSGALVKRGPGTLSLYRPAGMGGNGFTGNIRVEEGAVYLGRALAEGQSVYVCAGASYQLAVPADAAHITYEEPSEAPATGGLYTVNGEHPGDIDLVGLAAFDSDRLGGPLGGVTVSVGGVVTHAAATREHPFTLVGQYAGSTLNLLNTDIDQTPIRLDGPGCFRFSGDRLLTPADADDIQFAGGTYGKTGRVTFKTGADTYSIDNGSVSAANIYIGAEGVNADVIVRDGGLSADTRLFIGSTYSGDARAHTTGTLTLGNGTVSAPELRFGANGLTNGTSKGELYGTLNLEAGGTLHTSVIGNDEGRSQIVFKGGAFRPRGAACAVSANQTVEVDLIAEAGHDIVVNTVGTTNVLAAQERGQVRLTGEGGFVKRGNGLLRLGDGKNVGFTADYAGDTVVEGGVLQLACDNPLPFGAGKGGLAVQAKKSLDLNGHLLTVNALAAPVDGIVNGASQMATLAVGADGRDGVLNLALPANVTLEKIGAGTVDFTAGLPPILNVRAGTACIQPMTAFSHYRFKVEKVRGASANSMQIGEFKLMDGATDVTRPYASVSRSGTGKASPANEQPAKAVDGDLATKFLDFNGANDDTGSDALRDSCWLRLDYASPVRVTGYMWATGNDCADPGDARCRSPQNWRLQGSLDGETWIDLDVRTDYVQTSAEPSAWVDAVFEIDSAVSRTDAASVNVDAGAALELAGTHAFTLLGGAGTTVLAADAVAEFPGNGLVSGTVAGSGRIEKTGDGTLTVVAAEDFTADVVARGGTVCFGRGLPEKWFRLTIRKTNPDSDTAMQISEFKMFDFKGERVNLNLTMAPDGTAAERLSPGAFCKAGAYTCGKSTEDADRIFDGDTATKWCATSVGGLKTGDPKDWRTITLRLANDAQPAASYNFTTANDNPSRSPSSWLLEASRDGVTWRTVDERSDVPHPTTTFTDFNGGAPFELVSAADEAADVFRGVLEVAPGAVAEVVDETTQIAALRIDCASGAGTLACIDFAPNGVLHLTNFVPSGALTELPITLGEVRNAANLKSWTVRIDGVVNPSRRVACVNGKLVLVSSGVVIYIR
ncbi:MAG: discoidin domain-containing protein [Kiritimatiellia bacterium]